MKKQVHFRFFLPLILLISLSLLTNPLHAQFAESDLTEILKNKEDRLASGTVLDGTLHLIWANYEKTNGIPLSTNVGTSEFSNMDQKLAPLLMTPDKQKIGIRVRASNVGLAISELEQLGFIESGRHDGYGLIEGMLNVDQLKYLDDLGTNTILSVRPIYQATNNVGAVTSQADAVLESDRVRIMDPTITGSGINIGVLSDSYNDLGGEAAGIASGDLPAAGVTIIEDLGGMGSDEGRGMIELIHDIAPGSDIFFATAFTGELGFANNIRALANAGCQVIVDDVGYANAPLYQDGLVAQAVDEVAINQNVSYFSSAGNSANQAYEDTNPSFAFDPRFGVMAYDFDPGPGVDFNQEYLLDGSMRISLHWDDPFFTTNGVDTDLDILIATADGSGIFFGGTDPNILTQEPVEFFGASTGGPFPVSLYIVLAEGPAPDRIKIINSGTSHDPQEHEKPSGTTFAHSAAAEGSGVAAAPFFDIRPESFTSHGPVPILFEADGTRKATPEIRQKPDFTCTDGTNTTFFGVMNRPDIDGDDFPNFFGTSAAAPHAAAVAALVRQKFPDLSYRDVYNRLIGSTIDLHTEGFDNVTGYGLINAYDIFYPTTDDIPVNNNVLVSSDNLGFEEGGLDNFWETNSTGSGRIRISTEEGPCEGGFHMLMDTWGGPFGDTPGLNEAILSIDVTQVADITLGFDQKEFDDDDHPMPESFIGSGDFDGVAYSFNNVNWTRLVSLTEENSTNACQPFSFDINIPNENLTSKGKSSSRNNANVLFVKFQQFGAQNVPNDGFAFDNINVVRNLIVPNALAGAAAAEVSPVPTMSEWGLIIFGLLILNLAVVFLKKREALFG